MGKEFELKYTAADAAVLEEILRFLGGDCREIAMETTYYDTPARALSARKWTLRRRMENETSVITVKTAGDGKTRGEWEYEGDVVDGEKLVCLGAPEALSALLKAGIEPVCGAKFTRRAVTVCREGTVLEVALDAGFLFREERKLPIFEVETELKSGDESAAVAFAEVLAETFSLTEESGSKFVRAVNL